MGPVARAMLEVERKFFLSGAETAALRERVRAGRARGVDLATPPLAGLTRSRERVWAAVQRLSSLPSRVQKTFFFHFVPF